MRAHLADDARHVQRTAVQHDVDERALADGLQRWTEWLSLHYTSRYASILC